MVSPFLGKRCRFYPTCSQYAKECLETKSLSQAVYLILRRLLKCHPWHAGGYDPVLAGKGKVAKVGTGLGS